ncbi:MAG: DUF4292 domain-containing protein [Bacteroidetes bacterium]|nr:DUF4292 domain-containing protein [Bacteroidota bacterium]
MYKEVAIYFILLFFSGCSVFKIQDGGNAINKNYVDLDKIVKKNLTNYSFYIQRADIEINSGGERRTFLASVKFNRPDTFLISIRSKSGIEAARVFLTNDTLLVNDRINKIVYYGSGEDLILKYGYSGYFLPLLFGDFIFKGENVNDTVNCNEGVLNIISNYKEKGFKYCIDCYSEKILSVEIINEIETRPVIIEYLDSDRKDKIDYYSQVQLSNLKGFERIILKYEKIDVPYKGTIEFIPGKNYEQVRIR